MSLTFISYSAKHGERLASVFLNRPSFLIVVAWARDGSIMWHPLLPINTIIGFARSAKRKLFACIIACLRFLEVARQLAWLRELVEIFYQ